MINGIFTATWLGILNMNQIKVFFDETNDSNKTNNQYIHAHLEAFSSDHNNAKFQRKNI